MDLPELPAAVNPLWKHGKYHKKCNIDNGLHMSLKK
jgi:hypothetical protein